MLHSRIREGGAIPSDRTKEGGTLRKVLGRSGTAGRLSGKRRKRMKVLNMGSLNLDYVYQVDHILTGGETLASGGMEVFPGGKGLNQSIALAKAGVPVYHAGLIGEEGQMLLDICGGSGVDTRYIRRIPGNSGHTIIQVDRQAQNCILLYGGSNRAFTREYIDEVLEGFEAGDVLLLQNEINLVDYAVEKGWERGMKVVLNPSPMDDKLDAVDMKKVSLFLLNEVEGTQIAGTEDPDRILEQMAEKFPDAEVVLTLGSRGSVYQGGGRQVGQKAYRVQAVDTTAAGDTFTGYFIAGMLQGMEVFRILDMASRASALAVSRKGAAPSIPRMEEVLAARL